jgi:hypothetical protein
VQTCAQAREHGLQYGLGIGPFVLLAWAVAALGAVGTGYVAVRSLPAIAQETQRLIGALVTITIAGSAVVAALFIWEQFTKRRAA